MCNFGRKCLGHPWWSSGLNSAFPLQGAQVWSLIEKVLHATQWGPKKRNCQMFPEWFYQFIFPFFLKQFCRLYFSSILSKFLKLFIELSYVLIFCVWNYLHFYVLFLSFCFLFSFMYLFTVLNYFCLLFFSNLNRQFL